MHIHNCNCGASAGDAQHCFDAELATSDRESKVIVKFMSIPPWFTSFRNLIYLASSVNMFMHHPGPTLYVLVFDVLAEPLAELRENLEI